MVQHHSILKDSSIYIGKALHGYTRPLTYFRLLNRSMKFEDIKYYHQSFTSQYRKAYVFDLCWIEDTHIKQSS